jgi:cytochrome b561
MPLIGWAMLSAGGYPVRLTDGLSLPPILPHDLAVYALLRQAHTIIAILFFALILAHLSAALMHGLIRRDGVLRSMTTGHRRAAPEAEDAPEPEPEPAPTPPSGEPEPAAPGS